MILDASRGDLADVYLDGECIASRIVRLDTETGEALSLVLDGNVPRLNSARDGLLEVEELIPVDRALIRVRRHEGVGDD